MSDILKFACKAPNCGRRFTTQEGLNTHFKLRHPKLNNINNETKENENEKEKKEKEKASMERIIKQISRTKLNPHEKHHILQPIDHKGLSSSLLNNIKRKSQPININKDQQNNSNINNSNTKEMIPSKKIISKINKSKENINITNKNKQNTIKEKKNKEINKSKAEKEIEEVEIPNIIEEKQKKLLNNLFGQINSLENYLEKDCEFHKQFTLPEVPDYDKMYDSDEEEDEDLEENKEKKGKEKKEEKEKYKNLKKEEKNLNVITIEMIFNKKGQSNYDEKNYEEINKINLSKQNIVGFKNNRNIPFEKLTELYILNLSYNHLSEANDILYFENLKELYINNNKIEDISFCESLPNLIILNVENNNIITITSLNICSKLKTLKLSYNKIKYLNSTLRTIKNLKYLEELSIKENPFLTELFSYREYFISNYPKINKLDEEIIDNNKRNFAEDFYKENNPLYNNAKNRPMSSRIDYERIKNNNNLQKNYSLFDNEEEFEEKEDNEEDIFNINNNNDIFAKTQVDFEENKNNNINVINYKKNENKNINEEIKNENKNNNNNDKNNDKNNEEGKKLKIVIEEQNKIINKLKIELDNSSKLNKKYEEEIERYKAELDEETDFGSQNYSMNNLQNNSNDEEMDKIIKELEIWKKEYFELLEKSMNNKNSNEFSKDLFNNNKNDMNNTNENKTKIIERPKTACINSELSRNFEKLYEEINILKNKNNADFEDIIGEEAEEEENEEEDEKEDVKEEIKDETIIPDKKDNENINKIKNEKIEINQKEEKQNENEEEDEIPDSEIEEMLRKSYQDLKMMKQEIKAMNEAVNKNPNVINTNNKVNNNNKIENKHMLKPIIVKKDNNSNLANKNFGKQGNIISGINKNKYENNKNSSQRYQGLLYKLKK